MEELLSSNIVPIYYGFLFFTLASRYGYFIDKKLNQSARQEIFELMDRIVGKDKENNWISLFPPIFDRLFDPDNSGRPRFWRSALASALLIIFISASWVLFHWERAVELYNMVVVTDRLLLFVFLVTIFSSAINFAGDYISFWETRFVIGRMVIVKEKVNRIVLLLLDLVATVVVYVIGLLFGTCAFFVFKSIANRESLDMADFGDMVSEIFDGVFFRGLTFSHDDPIFDIFGIFFYTTLFTSVWLWVFVVGLALWPPFKWLRRTLNAEESPVGVAMTIGGVVLGLVITAIGYAV